MTGTPSVLSAGILVADTYEVQHLLGKGGMGEVWLATHRRLPGKRVAIKVLHLGGGANQAEIQARFRREAEIAAKLAHPNIVQVLDYNALPGGEPYLVMELLEGESLAGRLRQGPMSPEAVRSLVVQVGAALTAAHAAGVVHRDLKPENIFLVPTSLGDQVKVLDFGISKMADSHTVQTTDSVLVGTPLYMSPEQALGNNSEVTNQSDVFSLGVICYEALTGKPPFVADSIAKVVFRIAYEPHPSLSSTVPALPPQIVTAIDHALAKQKGQRTSGIREFVSEFTGQPMPAVSADDDESSGVYKPGMALSESMLSGGTVAPSTPGLRATPAPASRPAAPVPAPVSPTPPPARSLTPWLAAGAALVVALGVLGAVVARSGSDAVDAPPRAGQVDAGPEAVVDAGAALAAVVDAGGPAEVEAQVDAGPAPVAHVVAPRESQPSPEEAKRLGALKTEVADVRPDDAARKVLATMTHLKSDAAQREAYLLGLSAICRGRDLSLANTFANKLEGHGAGARKRAKTVCKAAWPDSPL